MRRHITLMHSGCKTWEQTTGISQNSNQSPSQQPTSNNDQEHKELDSTQSRHDPHLLAEKPNSSAWTPSSIDEPAASIRLSPRLANTGKDGAGHERPPQGTAPSNYCPITCLSTTWKVLSGIIAAKLQVHRTGYMSTAQKDTGKNTRGSKHQLLLDRAVTNDLRSRQTNMSTAWIAYRKAYDSKHVDLGMPGTIQCQHNTKVR